MPNKYLNKLQGHRIVVIGGTSGIGFAVAEASIEHGAIVTVASSKQANIDKTIERIKSSYPDFVNNINGKVCDLASADMEANIKALFDFATDNGKHKLNHIVNTAGDFLRPVSLEDATAEKIETMNKVRGTGSILVAKHGFKYLESSHKSTYTVTGGVNSYKPAKGWSVLAGAGSAKDGLVRGLAVDLAPIRVNCVAPGAVDTELVKNIGGENYEHLIKRFAGMSLTKTVASPEDVAEAYIYIMKDNFITGTIVHTDGGLPLA